MRLRSRLDLVGTTLLAALGAGPLGCGGSAFTEGSGGSGGTGNPGTGGSVSSGGSVSAGSGGRISAGGASTGGASTGGASTGGTAMGGGSPINQFPCLNPTPAIDETTGYEFCENGQMRRVRQAECPSSLPRVEPISNYDPAVDQCQYDSDCTAQAHGYCAPDSEGGAYRYCRYGCRTDSDCTGNGGGVCVCSAPVGYCRQATCTTSADCLPGFDCMTHDSLPGCSGIAFACQMPGDGCASNADCGVGPVCSATTGVRQCTLPNCVIGRPFLVHGTERVAPCATRHDWLDVEIEPDLSGLGPELRERLAEEWARAGQMEHASIAAFARFALQLMSLGAPPELIERATQAMADETAHAKLCFALASSYRGASVGPGALAVEGSLDSMTLGEIVILTIREGCIGETVAAAEAAEAAEHATDPVVRAALRLISADETRHAELAWRFVKWAVDQGGAELARLVEREFFRHTRKAQPSRSGDLSIEDRGLLAAGVVPRALREVLRTQALTDIVAPCARALDGRTSASNFRELQG